MHLSRVHIALDNVQDRDVASLFDACVDEDVLWVQQTPHHIKYSRLTDRSNSSID
jgi:hypothetical protein